MSMGHANGVSIPSAVAATTSGCRTLGYLRSSYRLVGDMARVLDRRLLRTGRPGHSRLHGAGRNRSRPSIAPADPWAEHYRADGSLARLDGPSWQPLLGTTYYGQDVFSQLMLGTRQTILVGFITAILIGFIGTNVGLISGYFGGIVDEVLMRITDFFYAIPFLPFMMVMVALVDRSLPVIIASMAFIFWRTAARVVRAQVLTLKTRPYVMAARASGAGPSAHHVRASSAKRFAARVSLPHLWSRLGDLDGI